jgi:RimJ/RimL family protein N-acetyltransferase
MAMLPDVLPAGPVELRRWRPACLEPLMEAVAASRPELRRWMAWAQTMPSQAEQLDILRAGEAAFDAGAEWNFLLFTPGEGEAVGGAGLHPRAGPERIEIGYWVRSDRTGRGYATAAAGALAEAAFAHLGGIDRVEIRMDRANRASAAVPPKLGFRLVGHETRELLAPGHTGEGLIWALDRPP